MTDDDRAKFSRESVAMKLYISADANAALRAASARTTWSMSTIIDMLIKAHAPMMGVTPGIAEAAAEHEKASDTQVFSVPGGLGNGLPCSTEGCIHKAAVHFVRGGVGTYYCRRCYEKVQKALEEPRRAATATATAISTEPKQRRSEAANMSIPLRKLEPTKKDFDFDAE